MLNFLKIIVIAALLFVFTGCGLFDNGTDSVVDDYEVTWIDLHEQRALYKHERLVPPYVFAVGHDSSFIFAKQYPLVPYSLGKIDKSTVYFYIIERTKNEFQDKAKYGPMRKEAFDAKCSELGIKEPVFNLTYPTNL